MLSVQRTKNVRSLKNEKGSVKKIFYEQLNVTLLVYIKFSIFIFKII